MDSAPGHHYRGRFSAAGGNQSRAGSRPGGCPPVRRRGISARRAPRSGRAASGIAVRVEPAAFSTNLQADPSRRWRWRRQRRPGVILHREQHDHLVEVIFLKFTIGEFGGGSFGWRGKLTLWCICRQWCGHGDDRRKPHSPGCRIVRPRRRWCVGVIGHNNLGGCRRELATQQHRKVDSNVVRGPRSR
jgi:hypothetical protein